MAPFFYLGASNILDVSCPINWNHPLNQGLVAEWAVTPLSGWRGGLTFRDLVRGGRKPNDGTLTNGVAWSGPGSRPGGYGSLSFDGADDEVDVAASGSGPWAALGTGDFTLSCWAAKTAFTGNYEWWTSNWSSSGHMFGIEPFHRFAILDGAANQVNSTYTIPADGSWHHYAITRSSSTLQMYVDGTFNTTGSWSGSMSPGGVSLIGARPGGIQLWKGLLDDISIYNRALSASEVSRLYQESRLGNLNRWNWLKSPIIFPTSLITVSRDSHGIWMARATTNKAVVAPWNIRQAIGKAVLEEWSLRQMTGKADKFPWIVSVNIRGVQVVILVDKEVVTSVLSNVGVRI